jgi:nodulation protein E
MAERRVAITGLGIICALGHNVGDFWTALRAGRSGIGPIQSLDLAGIRFQNAAEVRGYDPAGHFTPSQLDLLDRFAQFALLAAKEAIADAAIEWTPALKARTAVVTGSCLGGQQTQDAAFAVLYRQDKTHIHPLIIARVMANAGASHISMQHGLGGPVFTISTACSSANHAIGQAFRMVRHGEADLAITGGSEAPFGYGHLKAWEAMRVIAPDTCRPFCADRKGMILGEGGAMLVLEPLDAARARGARILGEIVGFGMTSDANHIIMPAVGGPVRAMRDAIEEAGIRPEQVGYINAHGTGTPANDPTETAAIREVFGAHADRLPVSSTKSMHGHALGAAGALEAVATVLALRDGILPPTANFTTPDPLCNLDVIPNEAREVRAEYALSNSFAFGGLNAVLAFKAPSA